MKKYLLSIFLLLLVLTINSCQRTTDPATTQDLPGTNYAIPATETQTQPVTVTDMSIDSPMAATSDERDKCMGESSGSNMMMNDRHPAKDVPSGFVPFGRLLHALNLTDRQKAHIVVFHKGFRDCNERIMHALRESEKEIIDHANRARHYVLQQLKEGKIDRQVAHQKLREINARTRQALHDNPARERARLALHDCFCNMLRQIRSILTEEQLPLFDTWMRQYAKHCLHTDRG
ncbi:MAG: hypothetical protein HW421_50 [Ignavibacteria bacterium]|nr:hypothetical protein [Ignavibacteria bacterium]